MKGHIPTGQPVIQHRVPREPTPPLRRLCAMRAKRGQRGKGRRMPVGYVDGRKLVIFENTNAKSGDPGWTAFVSERQDSAA